MKVQPGTKFNKKVYDPEKDEIVTKIATVMSLTDGFVMARLPFCMPFVIHEDQVIRDGVV